MLPEQPVEVLPAWLQKFSLMLPITYALRAVRRSLLNAGGWADVAPDLAILGVFAILLLPASALLFKWALAKAKRDGSLAQY